MSKTRISALTALMITILLVGCAPIPYQRTYWDYWPTDKKYLVTGRVLTFDHRPVDQAKIVLVRQKSRTRGFAVNQPQAPEGNEIALRGRTPDLEVVAEHLVDVTSFGGEYSFQFEPWQAYDVWLYVDAEDQGFAPQYIMLNPHLRDRIMRGLGRNPIRVNVLLEPRQRGEEDCCPQVHL